MADGFQLPLNLQGDQAAIERRRRMAEMLMKQAMQGQQGVQAGRFYVPPSPLSALVQGFQGYAARKGMEGADTAQAGLGERYQQGLAEEVKRIAALRQGREAIPSPADELGGGPAAPAQPGDPRAAVMQALTSQYAPVRKMGELDFQGDLRTRESAAAQAARLHERQLALEARAEDKALDREQRAELAKEANALRLQIAELTKAAGGRNLPIQFLPTSQGYFAGNRGSGEVSPVTFEGKPLIRSTDDPSLQGDIAGEKKGGAVRGEAQATADINLPQTIADAEQSKSLIDQMVGTADGKVKPHPGFESYVGFTLTPGMRLVEGSDEAGFEALLKQVQGGAFLEAFQKLKGGGHITEIEGQKATEAVTRMSKSQNEAEFIKAAREYQQVIDAGVKRARQKAAGGATGTTGGWSIKPLP